MTGFSTVKHIQGKNHLEKHLLDNSDSRKEEIMATRWLVHRLLEDTEFFCEQAEVPVPADHAWEKSREPT